LDRRKQLKSLCKEQIPTMGVYQIKNNITGRILIGSSPNLSGRANSFLAQVEFHAHHSKSLKEDWTEHGPDSFSFEILETIKPDDVAKENWRKAIAALEDKWLSILQPYDDRGYNTQKKQR